MSELDRVLEEAVREIAGCADLAALEETRVRLLGRKSHGVFAQECHHTHECDSLIAIDERMIPGQTEGIRCGEFGKTRPLVVPFVDRPLDR